MVVERKIQEGRRLPALDRGLELVEPVPTEALLERPHVLEAAPAICARRTPDGASRRELLTPDPALELETTAACDAERGILLEFARRAARSSPTRY